MDRVTIIGSGGREHAIGWKIAQSPNVSSVLFSPGNAGTIDTKMSNLPLDGRNPKNFRALRDLFSNQYVSELIIIGPEAPLAEGIVDYLESQGIYGVFGPKKAAAKLEGDKFYSYDLMQKLRIPQAISTKCTTTEEAIEAIKRMANENGIVIKARGFTEGKGVTVCDTKEEALEEIVKHMGKFKQDVLIAERLTGQEFSVFGISDGGYVLPIELSVQDHKPMLDNDKGPNTGGMGAYCPAPIASRETVKRITEEIMIPVVQQMKKQNNEFRGFLYAGMIMTPEGPKVLEFNVRFGDPEAQPLMMMIKSDLYEILSLANEGRLDKAKIEFNPGASCCIVLASKGYPEKYEKGFPISGLEEASKIDSVQVFHAGTKFENSQVVTNGGRVLGVTAYSPDGIREARNLAYSAVTELKIGGGFHYRADIALKALVN